MSLVDDFRQVGVDKASATGDHHTTVPVRTANCLTTLLRPHTVKVSSRLHLSSPNPAAATFRVVTVTEVLPPKTGYVGQEVIAPKI